MGKGVRKNEMIFMFPFSKSKTFEGKEYECVGETPNKEEADIWAGAYRAYNYPVRVYPRVHRNGVQYEVYAFLDIIQKPVNTQQG
jgi:hypothetical protein